LINFEHSKVFVPIVGIYYSQESRSQPLENITEKTAENQNEQIFSKREFYREVTGANFFYELFGK
jgi:hypothetical protein